MTRISATFFRALLVCVPCSLAAACGPVTDQPPDGTLIVAVLGDARSLDPHMVTDAASMRMIENMYSTLLRYGDDYENMQLGLDLAESIDISDDYLIYTITLVPNATFHNGRPVSAEDVQYSIQRIRDQGVRAGQFSSIESIETPDDHTVVLRLSRPEAALETYLAHPMNAIVDVEVVQNNNGSLQNVDAGSGPYKLVEWQRGQHLRLLRHNSYHVIQRPIMETVIFRPLADETARSTAIRTGEVHIVHEVPNKDRDILDQADGVRIVSVPGTFWEYIGLNCTRPPLDQARMRQAIAWAIDREQLNRAIKFGQATVLTGGHIPPNHWAHADLDTYPQPEREMARRLLADAGYADGIELEMVVDSSIDYQVRAAEMVKQQLAAVGINVNLRGLEPGVFYDRLNNREFDSTLVGWLGFVDPDEWVADLFHTDGRFNQQGYSNESVDALIEEAARIHDRGQRKELYRRVQERITLDAPMVFLYVNPHTTAIRENVTGYRVHPTGTTLSVRDAQVHKTPVKQ